MTGKWDGDDSDESPNYRNPRGVLLDYMEYIVIYDFMYILDSPIPSETSSDEASKRPIRNKSFGSRSSSSLSSDDVDLKKNSTFRCQKLLVRLIEESTPADSEADQGQRSFK